MQPVDSFVFSTGRFRWSFRFLAFRFSVHGMSSFAALVAGLTNPLDALASFDAQVLLDAGCSPARVRELVKVLSLIQI